MLCGLDDIIRFHTFFHFVFAFHRELAFEYLKYLWIKIVLMLFHKFWDLSIKYHLHKREKQTCLRLFKICLYAKRFDVNKNIFISFEI